MTPPTLRRRTLLATGLGNASLLATAATLPATTAPRRTATGPNGARLGLALGGGSARGFSHIGVLKALDEAGYRPDVLVGTSAGALVGVMYAAGFSPWQIEEVALKVRDIELADTNPASKRGMYSGEALQKLVNGFLKHQPIERLKLPYAAIATNLATGELVALKTGDAGLAVRASCAIPGVFIPTLVDGVELVDGGLVSPLPVKQARLLGADVVIAVDVGTPPKNTVGSGLYEVILQSFEIMGRALAQLEAQQAEFVIRPDTARFSSTDFAARKDLIQTGYEAGRRALPDLLRKIAPRAKGG
jgi:NTE family protein